MANRSEGQSLLNVLFSKRNSFKDRHLSPVDEVWGIYLSGAARTPGELVAKLNDPEVLKEYKAKILDVFLSPDPKKFKGVPPDVAEYGIRADDIPDSLLVFTAERIPQYIEEALSILRKSYSNRNTRGTLTRCNSLIPGLVGRLPFDNANRLFEHFSVTDPTLEYAEFPVLDPYYPIKNLLHARYVPNDFKRRATGPMHRIISEEVAKENGGRTGEHADSFSHYSSVLTSLAYMSQGDPGRLLIDQGHFEEEIDFMLGVGVDVPVIDPRATATAFRLLREEELGFRFIDHQATAGRSGIKAA